MQAKAQKIQDLLPHGSVKDIAAKLKISRQAVDSALKKMKPGHPAVIEALRMARESGALATAQDLATLKAA